MKDQLAVRLPQVTRLEVEVLSHQPQQSCVFVLCHKDDGSQVGKHFALWVLPIQR